MASFLRQFSWLSKTRRRALVLRGHRAPRPSLTTRQGVTLLFGIAALMGLVLIFVYYVWFLPVERSLQ